MTAPTIVAVDPGHRWTALVVRTGDSLRARELLTRRDDELLDSWALRCASAVWKLADTYYGRHVAVEAVTAPTGHSSRGRSGLVDPGPLLDTAVVVGAVLARCSGAFLVAPGGFGPTLPSRAALLAAYPPALVGPRERTGSGKGPHQHLRAAWDLAAAARLQLRLADP